MRFQTILLERSEGAAWLTLNRPHALNATNAQMHEEMFCALADVAADSDVRALVLTGAGDRAFCIGSDLDFLKQAFDAVDGLEWKLFRDYLERLNRLFFAIEELPVPTIAMVNGKARAGGFEMVLACDIVLIANEAVIGDVHTPYGHMPGAGGTQRTARKIGAQRALELLYTGRWLTGPEAVSYGLALKSVPLADLRSETMQLIKQLGDKTRESLMHIKRCVHRGLDLPLKDGVSLEVATYLDYLTNSPLPIQRFKSHQAERDELVRTLSST